MIYNMPEDKITKSFCDNYFTQVLYLADRAAKWRAENPGREALFNVKMDYIGTLSSALANGVMTANDAAKEMFKFMAEGCQHEPTVGMTVAAIDEKALERAKQLNEVMKAGGAGAVYENIMAGADDKLKAKIGEALLQQMKKWAK